MANEGTVLQIQRYDIDFLASIQPISLFLRNLLEVVGLKCGRKCDCTGNNKQSKFSSVAEQLPEVEDEQLMIVFFKSF